MEVATWTEPKGSGTTQTTASESDLDGQTAGETGAQFFVPSPLTQSPIPSLHAVWSIRDSNLLLVCHKSILRIHFVDSHLDLPLPYQFNAA